MKRPAALAILLSAFLVFPLNAKIVGDFNQDGRINIFDLLVFLQYLSGKDTGTDLGKEYELVNGQIVEPGDSIVMQGIVLVSIPAGSFQMGSAFDSYSQPIHTVTLDGFWMGKTEVTQEQYQEIMLDNPSKFSGNDSLPVEEVSWQDAVRYCNTLSQFQGLDQCYNLQTWECDFSKNGFRLPTEAEWEYACRAGTSTRYYSGNNFSNLDSVGWFQDNASNRTHTVANKAPNAWGLYDIHGNVWEWCYEFKGEYSGEVQTNPKGPATGPPDQIDHRIYRGGSYLDGATSCQSTYRNGHTQSYTGPHVGFRVVRRKQNLPK